MSRFFVDVSNIDLSANKVFITGDDVNHIKNVLREKPGGRLIACDGLGTDYYCVIENIEKGRITLAIEDSLVCSNEPPVEITLFQGVPKSDKMELIIQKTVELGINRIVPVITERTVVKFKNDKDIGSKTARWRKISMEAAKQCNRGIIPFVEEPVSFEEAAASRQNKTPELLIIPYEKEDSVSIAEALSRFRAENRSGAENKKSEDTGINKASVFIGPEGGFTEKEIEIAVKYGFKPVTLGPRILRTETAGLCVISILMHLIGDIR